MIIVVKAFALVLIAFVGYRFLRLMDPIMSGPSSRDRLVEQIEYQLKWRYILSAGIGVSFGFLFAAPKLSFLDLIPALVFGWLIGSLWARGKLRLLEVEEWSISSPSARHVVNQRQSNQVLFKACVPPTPLLDILVIIGCEGVGFMIGYWISMVI